MRKRKLTIMPTILALAALILVGPGCSENNPTGPAAGGGDIALDAAKVSVGGQSLDGQDIRQGDHEGPVRYEARLTDRQGHPHAGGEVRVRYGMAGMTGPMHDAMPGYRHLGEFPCYDDGTHGDPVASDGVYCFVDEAQQHGCHRDEARPGEYRYEFCGFDRDGRESGRMDVIVTLLP